jgi:hypothetical protein
MVTKSIKKIFSNGHSTSCLVIPRKIAEEHNLTDDDHAIVERTGKKFARVASTSTDGFTADLTTTQHNGEALNG